VRKALLRTPVDGFRVSSGFGVRKHPILGYSKLHKGIDFAAPAGTPIYAGGDGVIEEAGRKGAYGNYVRIRHNGTYRTAYAHLSRFAKGMKVGRRVRQGEVIGFVGSTGRSTGPHLHYEVIVSGKQINPLSVKLPTGEKLAGAEKERFLEAKTAIDRLRDQLQLQQLVASGDNSLLRPR
jgi:murein DD-endopeptidase MepM/ murein hydrolase activator NlpD